MSDINIRTEFDEINEAISDRIKVVIDLDLSLGVDLLQLIMEAEALSHRIGLEEGFAVGRMSLEEAEREVKRKRG